MLLLLTLEQGLALFDGLLDGLDLLLLLAWEEYGLVLDFLDRALMALDFAEVRCVVVSEAHMVLAICL